MIKDTSGKIIGLIITLLGLFLLPGGLAFAAPTTIAAFEMSGLAGNEATFNATTNDANLQTVVISRGAGINPSALANAFSSTAFVVGGTKAAAITNNEYLQVELEPKNNFVLYLNTINFNIRRSGTGPNAYQWQYSLDGFATAGIDVGAPGSYTGTETNGLAMPAIDLSGVAALQNIPTGSKVTFRLYAWGATGAAGTFAIGRLTGNDLSFVGTVNPKKIASFDLIGENGDQTTFDATTLDADVNNVVLTRGGGVEPSFLLNSFSSTDYTVGGTKTDAINNREYIELKIQAKDYYVMFLDGLTFNIRRSGTGPNAYQWQYSFDDFATSGTDLGAEGLYNGTENDGLAMPAITLSGIPSLQNVKTVTFRLYAWGATGSAGTFAIGRLADDDLVFTGNVLLNNIVAFDFIGANGDQVTFNATTLNSNLNNSILSRGAGIIPSFLLDAFSSKDYVVGGTKTDATNNNEYMQFNIQAQPGYNVSLGSLDYNLRRSITGPNVYQWQYSLDGFVFRAIDFGSEYSYTTTVDTGTARPQIDLSSLPELQNVRSGNTVSLRLYAWGATNASGTFAFGRLAGDDIKIIGETALNIYAFNYTAGAGGSLTGSSTQQVLHGYDGLPVTAVPDANYEFVDWSDSSTVNPRTDLNAGNDITVSANFILTKHTLNYTAGAGGSLTGSSTQLISHGSDGLPVTAVPNAGYEFVDWSDSSIINPRTDTNVTNNHTYYANFRLSSQSSSGGGGAFYPPRGIGSGVKDVIIDMDSTKEIGDIDGLGINMLGYIRGQALFTALVSLSRTKELHAIKIIDLDLYKNIVTVQVSSNPQNFSLNLDEMVKVDLDNDGISDITIQFMNVYINRAELTIKSLSKDFITVQNPVSKPDASVVPSFVFTQDLMTGMINEDVRQLQIFLNSRGFMVVDTGPGSPGNETNKFGAGTHQALIRYQEANKINPASGYFGADTREKVNQQLNGLGSNNNFSHRLLGRILLQVQNHGEAWYVNTVDFKKYYMQDGDAAYEMMRYFSLGITDNDLLKIPTVSHVTDMNQSVSVCNSNTMANRLRGKILLQVEKNGEAWYVDPVKCRAIYLKNGVAAYEIMKYMGLGILNSDLDKMQTGVLSQ